MQRSPAVYWYSWYDDQRRHPKLPKELSAAPVSAGAKKMMNTLMTTARLTRPPDTDNFTASDDLMSVRSHAR